MSTWTWVESSAIICRSSHLFVADFSRWYIQYTSISIEVPLSWSFIENTVSFSDFFKLLLFWLNYGKIIVTLSLLPLLMTCCTSLFSLRRRSFILKLFFPWGEINTSTQLVNTSLHINVRCHYCCWCIFQAWYDLKYLSPNRARDWFVYIILMVKNVSSDENNWNSEKYAFVWRMDGQLNYCTALTPLYVK